MVVCKEWVVGLYSYYNQFCYNFNNELDLYVLWMYMLIGQLWKIVMVVCVVQQLFINVFNGVIGNDDFGMMLVWYLFSVLGLYLVVLGSGQFLLYILCFVQVDVDFGQGCILIVKVLGVDGCMFQYVQGVQVDGCVYVLVWLDWVCLQQGGCIDVVLVMQVLESGWGMQLVDLLVLYCVILGVVFE